MHPPDHPSGRRPEVDVAVAELAGADAHHALARLRAEHPVAWIPAVGAWLVTRHDLGLQVMRDDVRFTVDDPRFSTAQVVGPSMLSLDGAAHRRHRSALAAPFRPRRVVDRFAAEVGTLTAGLLARLAPWRRADLRTELAGPLSVAVVASALGLQDLHPGTVLAWYREIVGAVSALSAGEPVSPRAAAAVGELDDHVRAGLTRPGASVLRDATGTLTDTEIVANAAVMMFGGIETTEGMITNAVLHLLQRPAAADAARANAALLPTAVEESLRLEPAAAAIDRYATADVRLGGAAIRQGDLVRVSISAANRDPAVFAAPDRFDLARAGLREQLAFAFGPHVCLAMDLARLETRVALSAVLALPGLRLAEPAAATGLIFRKPTGLVVEWDRA